MPGPYPSIEDIFNLARVTVQDAMEGGAGRVITDSWAPLITLLNAAVIEYQRDLENGGVETLRRELFASPITPINGRYGLGVPDPATFQNLSYTGFFDGLNTTSAVALPADLLTPLRLWESTTSSYTPFDAVLQAEAGLHSGMQSGSIGQWEWRGDAIWWNGSTLTKDIRLRYQARAGPWPLTLPPAQFPNTVVPFADSLDPLANLIAYAICAARLPPGGAAEMRQNYEKAKTQIINRSVRQRQGARYHRPSYGDEEDYPFWY